MTSAGKRARKKENARNARAARQTAARRSKNRAVGLRVGAAVALVVAVVGLVSILGGGDDQASDTTSTASTVPEETQPTTPTTSLPALVKTECNDDPPPENADRKSYTEAPAQTIDPAKTYTARISTSCGDIVVALDAQNAPVGTNNFVFLAREGFFDGLDWHRVVNDFVIQGGDPKGDGSGGPGYTVVAETPSGATGVAYPIGAIAAAKSADAPPGSMGSQFFIATGAGATNLPNDYAMFGTVSEGLDVARTLESFSTGDGPPTRPLYIFSIEITES